MTIAANARDMVGEVFGGALPSIVTPAFAAGLLICDFKLIDFGSLFVQFFSDFVDFLSFAKVNFTLVIIFPDTHPRSYKHTQT